MATEEKRMAQLVDNAAGWAANDIVPLRGEYAVEDAGVDSRIKVGDGASQYSVLNFVSRRTTAEFNADVDSRIAATSTDVSAGAANAGELVKLDSGGEIDASMIPGLTPGGEFNILGNIDFTAAPPSPPGGFQGGDAYFNTTAGQFDGAWLFGQDVNLNERGCEVGDLVIWDQIASAWQFVTGRRMIDLVDRDYLNDAAAAGGGVPIGGMYHTAGTVKVRVV
jgi:hypothetical protein